MTPRRPKMAPTRLQDAFCFYRTHPRHVPDAPKTRQDCPRHLRTTQKSFQDFSKARFSRVWGFKNKHFGMIVLSINPSKPLCFQAIGLLSASAGCAKRIQYAGVPPPAWLDPAFLEVWGRRPYRVGFARPVEGHRSPSNSIELFHLGRQVGSKFAFFRYLFAFSSRDDIV